ncbi:hypothetical protein WJ977_07840 [Achromobacter xylosoxidans]
MVPQQIVSQFSFQPANLIAVHVAAVVLQLDTCRDLRGAGHTRIDGGGNAGNDAGYQIDPSLLIFRGQILTTIPSRLSNNLLSTTPDKAPAPPAPHDAA